MINRKPRKARPETRRTGLARLAIPTLFLVSPDKTSKDTNMVVVVVVALLFYVHGKHLRSCRDGQLT